MVGTESKGFLSAITHVLVSTQPAICWQRTVGATSIPVLTPSGQVVHLLLYHIETDKSDRANFFRLMQRAHGALGPPDTNRGRKSHVAASDTAFFKEQTNYHGVIARYMFTRREVGRSESCVRYLLKPLIWP